MTTPSTTPAAANAVQAWPAAAAAAPWVRAIPWNAWNVPMASMPWELMIQGLMLHSSLWLAGATMQAQWWSQGLGALGRGAGWPVWHEPAEQLA
jgi:hypothetical protein